jgi:hypothetical protein
MFELKLDSESVLISKATLASVQEFHNFKLSMQIHQSSLSALQLSSATRRPSAFVVKHTIDCSNPVFNWRSHRV